MELPDLPVNAAQACPCKGGCCPSVSVTREEADRLVAASGKENVIRETNNGLSTEIQDVMIDGKRFQYCVFLDTKTKLCNVYESRPKICQDFQCP